jgi:hypothetical protein
MTEQTNDGSDELILVSVEESDDYPESLTFDDGAGMLRLYAAPDLIRNNPLLCLRLFKLVKREGSGITFHDSATLPRARLAEVGGNAELSYYDPHGQPVWTLTIRPEDCLGDAPQIVPQSRPMYRLIAPFFMLFILIISAFILFALRHWLTIFTTASIAFTLFVAAMIAVLIAVRQRLRL